MCLCHNGMCILCVNDKKSLKLFFVRLVYILEKTYQSFKQKYIGGDNYDIGKIFRKQKQGSGQLGK